MGTANFARQERATLCDLIQDLGPDAPTLCAGWTARDLAAHLILRERRPDAVPGITLHSLAGHTAKVQAVIATQPFDTLVDRLRRPPAWSPLSGFGPIDRLANTSEFFIHTEDVRRAAPDWAPRSVAPGLLGALWPRVRGAARRALRRFPATVTVVAEGYGHVRGGAGGPELTLTGDPGELIIFLTGRQRASRAKPAGQPDLVERLRTAPFGQ